MFPRYLQRAFSQPLCLFFNILLYCIIFYTAGILNVSFATILRGGGGLYFKPNFCLLVIYAWQNLSVLGLCLRMTMGCLPGLASLLCLVLILLSIYQYPPTVM